MRWKLPPGKYTSEVYDEERGITKHVFENGFALHIAHTPRKKFATVYLRAKTGPVYEQPMYHGISELVEHLVQNERKYRFLPKVQGDYNGDTGRHVTDVWLDGRAPCTHFLIRLLYNRIRGMESALRVAATEKEIVVDERELWEDDPADFVLDRMLLPTIFRGTSLERIELGTEKSYSLMAADILRQYVSEFWVPNNMAMAVVGYFPDDSGLLETTALTFGTMERREVPDVYIDMNIQPSGEKAKLFRDTRRINFAVGVPVPCNMHEDAVPLWLADAVLSGNGMGRLEREIRSQRGWSYDPQSDYKSFDPFAGAFYAHMGTRPKHFQEALAKTLDVLEKLKSNITESEVRNAKGLVLSTMYDKIDNDADRFAKMILDNHFFPCPIYDPKEFEKLVEQTTRSNVIDAVRRYLDPSKYVIAALGPVPETF